MVIYTELVPYAYTARGNAVHIQHQGRGSPVGSWTCAQLDIQYDDGGSEIVEFGRGGDQVGGSRFCGL